MQDRQQAIGIGFVDDEGQVQVVGRLRDHVHALAAEGGPYVRQLVQQRTHATADQGDRRARHDHLHLADLRQVGRQRGQHIGVDQVLGRVQRHGDVGLRRTDQVHRQPVLLEQVEHIGQEADLLPHADAFHRHQHDAVAAADRLHARDRRSAAIDAGARQFRALGIEDGHRHAGIAARLDRARVQHLGASRGDFLCFVVVQAGQQARVRHVLWIGAEHARHVGPDLHAAGAEQRTEVRRRGIRTAAAEDGGTAIGVAGNEALGDQQAGRLRAETLHPLRVGAPLAVHRQALRPVALVRLRRHRVQPLAGIHPAHVQARGMQVGRTQRRGQQFALAQHVGLPVQRAGGRTRVIQQALQRGQALGQHLAPEAQLDQETLVALNQRRHAIAAVRRTVGDRGQFVGDPGQRRDHHQHARAGLFRTFFRQLPDRVPAVATRHRGAAELQYDPTIDKGGS